MPKNENNYAFIDSQNLNMGIKELGWNMDWERFRVYLQEKYSVQTAYLFIGYIKKNEVLYKALQKYGYVLCFKKIVKTKSGIIKGNIDANLIFQAMLDYQKMNKAILVTSDGDFDCLVEHLYTNNKLAGVLSPHKKLCSILLKKSAKEKMFFLSNLRNKLEYKMKPDYLRTEP
jgi:uncharacterized LabA/DUF88 family protein